MLQFANYSLIFYGTAADRCSEKILSESWWPWSISNQYYWWVVEKKTYFIVEIPECVLKESCEEPDIEGVIKSFDWGHWFKTALLENNQCCSRVKYDTKMTKTCSWWNRQRQHSQARCQSILAATDHLGSQQRGSPPSKCQWRWPILTHMTLVVTQMILVVTRVRNWPYCGRHPAWPTCHW